MAGTKLITFNVLKLRACAKPASLHCEQAKESFCWYLNSWLSSRQMSWRYERFTSDMSVPQCYHWNHLEIHSHIGNVISMTLEYDYINGTSVHTTMSSGDLFKRSVCLQCTTGTNFNTVDILSMTSVKQYVTESYDTTESIPLLWFSFERLFYSQ